MNKKIDCAVCGILIGCGLIMVVHAYIALFGEIKHEVFIGFTINQILGVLTIIAGTYRLTSL